MLDLGKMDFISKAIMLHDKKKKGGFRDKKEKPTAQSARFRSFAPLETIGDFRNYRVRFSFAVRVEGMKPSAC